MECNIRGRCGKTGVRGRGGSGEQVGGTAVQWNQISGAEQQVPGVKDIINNINTNTMYHHQYQYIVIINNTVSMHGQIPWQWQCACVCAKCARVQRTQENI